MCFFFKKKGVRTILKPTFSTKSNLEKISVASTIYIGPESPWLTSNFEQKSVVSTSTSHLGVHYRQATWNKNQLPLYRIWEFAIDKQLITKISCLYIGPGSPRLTNNSDKKLVVSTSDPRVHSRQTTRNKNQLPLRRIRKTTIDKQLKTKTSHTYIGTKISCLYNLHRTDEFATNRNSEQSLVTPTSDSGVCDQQQLWSDSESSCSTEPTPSPKDRSFIA